MAKMGTRLRLAWLHGVEALGTSASNLASNAKFKVAELTMESRRREILTEFNLKAYELWQKGAELPPALDEMFRELYELDEKLSDLRAQRYSSIQGEGEEHESAEPQTSDEAATDGEANDFDALPDVPTLDMPAPEAPSAEEPPAEAPQEGDAPTDQTPAE